MLMPDDDGGNRRWRVAFVAHGAKRSALAVFARRHRDLFASWDLLATQATGEILTEATGLRVRTVLAETRGGDIQVGAEMAAGDVDALIFLRDVAAPAPEEPDVAVLLRVADLHNVAMATNLAAAECVVRALAPEQRPVVRV
jgi:methylglyoxal synthase